MVPGMIVIAIVLSLAIAGFLFASGVGLLVALLAYSLSGIGCILLIACARSLLRVECPEGRNRRAREALELE